MRELLYRFRYSAIRRREYRCRGVYGSSIGDLSTDSERPLFGHRFCNYRGFHFLFVSGVIVTRFYQSFAYCRTSLCFCWNSLARDFVQI